MAEIVTHLWGMINYLWAVYLAAFLVASKMERKKNIWLPVFLVILFPFVAELAYLNYVAWAHVNYADTLGAQVFVALVGGIFCACIFGSSVLFVKSRFACTTMEALYCASVGYCMQHLTQRLTAMISTIFAIDERSLLYALILCVITGGFYAFIYYIIIRHADFRRVALDGKIQIFVSIIVILTTTVLSALGTTIALKFESNLMEVIVQAYCVITAGLALFLQFSLLFQKNTEHERDILSQLMKANASHFEIEKSAIDAINVKCHDLKHQMHRLERGVDSEYLQEMNEAVNNYDFVFHTGNVSLDAVLTMKSLTCESKGIVFTFMGNGDFLSFIRESDLYSLLGNILDNAIEAVEAISDPDKKVISLTISKQNEFVSIHCENYFEEKIVYVDGHPVTHKEDKENHGFGIHSMKLITDKYQGSLKFSDEYNVFMLDIVFPYSNKNY